MSYQKLIALCCSLFLITSVVGCDEEPAEEPDEAVEQEDEAVDEADEETDEEEADEEALLFDADTTTEERDEWFEKASQEFGLTEEEEEVYFLAMMEYMTEAYEDAGLEIEEIEPDSEEAAEVDEEIFAGWDGKSFEEILEELDFDAYKDEYAEAAEEEE